jgi:pteridine reductase
MSKPSASPSSTRPVAIVTGGAQRIGGVICKSLHENGYNLVIHYRNSQEAANTLRDQLNNSRHDSVITLPANLGDIQAIKNLVAQASRHWGRLDALINNASSFYPTPISEAKEDQWDDLFNSNVKGAFFISQASAPFLKKQKGSIINIIDIHGEKPLKDHSIYCMAKAALGMMTQSLAKELAPIRVNGISPGAIMWPEQQGKDSLSSEQKENIINKIPLGQPGTPNDIANTIVFLLLNAPYITGQIINVDGGRSLSM